MSHRRDSGSDAVHVIPSTNDLPPENLFPNPSDNATWATEDDYSRVWDDTESPSKKTRGSPSSSSSETKSFFKMKLCGKFRAGTCPYVANLCHFAHSVEELRRPESETPEEFKIPAESGRSYKGRRCKKFYSGEGCSYGESCTFLHDEASRNRENFAISLGPRGVINGNNVALAQAVKPSNWKTRICNKWEITGYCPFGANCNFAHGASELHNLGGVLIEGEGKMTGQAETVTSLGSPGVPPQRTSSAVMQKPNGVRTQRKWKGPNKISRVYGDWIDDIEKEWAE